MKTIVSSATLLSVAAGFAGGFASQIFLSPQSVLAQMLIPVSRPDKRPAATEVDAQRFVLVDSSGNVNAEMRMKDGKPEIVLYDKEGRIAWRATTSSGIQPVTCLGCGGM